MNRHDIRLRRERMTTGRMQRHKDYKQLMEKHKRQRRGKRASFWLALAIALLLFALLLLAGLKKFSQSEPSPPGEPPATGILLPGTGLQPPG